MSKRPRTDDEEDKLARHCQHRPGFMYTPRGSIKERCAMCELETLREEVEQLEGVREANTNYYRQLESSKAECEQLRAALRTAKGEAAAGQPMDVTVASGMR